MTFHDFINRFDQKGNIILLEGKRKVQIEDQEKLIALGKLLASRTSNMIFRSGNASGADQLFSDGVSSIDKSKLQVIAPYSGHRSGFNNGYRIISLDEIDLVAEPEIIFQSKYNKKTENLIDPFVSGVRNPFTLKASYIIRDTIKVIGFSKLSPATIGIFYDDLCKPRSGGTGHTINICEKNGIPVINQSIWFDWLCY